jgi:hypothetical protein
MPFPVLRRALPAILCASALAGSATAAGPHKADRADKKDKPTVTVKATPIMGFSPARMVVTAELRGGADDYEEFYCATVEWDWGDDTRSQSSADCEPYEAGKSEIKRRFTMDHVFNTSGDYRIEFRLKRKNKTVGSGSAEVKVRPGIRDGDRDRIDE